MGAAALQEQSTKDLNGSREHKLAFLKTFRRWEVLFKRKDSGDMQAARWLIAEYYDSLGFLSLEGFEALTKMLKERCVFFPTISECLAIMKPKDRYDYGHPFLKASTGEMSPLILSRPSARVFAIGNSHKQAPNVDD